MIDGYTKFYVCATEVDLGVHKMWHFGGEILDFVGWIFSFVESFVNVKCRIRF